MAFAFLALSISSLYLALGSTMEWKAVAPVQGQKTSKRGIFEQGSLSKCLEVTARRWPHAVPSKVLKPIVKKFPVLQLYKQIIKKMPDNIL